jgi:hypothetical protein
MPSTTSYAQIAYEHTPRYQGAPAVSPYDVSTAVRYMPIQNLGLTPAPAYVDRSDELRGIEGSVAQLIDRFAPGGSLSVRAYVNDLIFLLGLSGFQGAVTAGAATVDKWTISQGGTWTGGTFTLTIAGAFTGSPVTTGPIPYNATASQVQIALQAALPQAGSVVVTGGPFPGVAVVANFTGPLSGLPITVTLGVNSLTGTAPVVTLVHTATGANGGSSALPDGGFPPTGTNVWVFTKRAGIAPKTAQITAVYVNEQVFMQGQGYALTALNGTADGNITGTWVGLVYARINDPSLSPAYDTQAIPHLRRGDMSLTWLSGSGVTNDFTWAIANPLEAISSFGVPSYYPDQIEQGPGRVEVTGTIPKRTLSTVDIDALLNAGTFAGVATWHSPVPIGATLYPYSMFMQMPSAQIIGGDPDPLTNARRFGGSWNWRAAWDEAAGYDVKFTLVSSLAATAVASAGVGL